MSFDDYAITATIRGVADSIDRLTNEVRSLYDAVERQTRTLEKIAKELEEKKKQP